MDYEESLQSCQSLKIVIIFIKFFKGLIGNIYLRRCICIHNMFFQIMYEFLKFCVSSELKNDWEAVLIILVQKGRLLRADCLAIDKVIYCTKWTRRFQKSWQLCGILWVVSHAVSWLRCTDKKEKKIFLIYKEIQRWSSCKVKYEEGIPNICMRKCANISPSMRRPLVIYDFATAPFCISLYMRKIWFSFLSVCTMKEQLLHMRRCAATCLTRRSRTILSAEYLHNH